MDENDQVVPNTKNVGYTYRNFDLGNNIQLQCRCEVDAYLDEEVVIDERTMKLAGDKRKFSQFNKKTVNMHILTDVEPGKYNIDFKKTNEKNHATILTNEYESNNHTVSKWATKAYLGGVDYMSIGFGVRRFKHDSESDKEQEKGHNIIQNVVFKTDQFCKTLNLNCEKNFNIVKLVINCIMDNLRNKNKEDEDAK